MPYKRCRRLVAISRVLSVLLFAAVHGSPALAQPPVTPGAGGPAKTRFDASLTGFHQFAAEAGGGEFSVSSVFLRFSAERTLSAGISAGVSLKYDADDYDFSGTTGLGGVEPWNDVHRFGIGLPLFSRLGNHWSLGATPSIDWLGETDADLGDAVSFGLTAFAFKSVTRDRSLGVGAGVFKTIDDDTRFFPFLAVDWRFNEHWRLANPFEADALGPAGLELSYDFNERWRLSGGGVYRFFRFRLNDQGEAPNGIGENEGVVAFMRLRRAAPAGLDLDVYAGAVLEGKLELKDARGSDLSAADYDPAPFLAVTLSAKF